MSSDNELRLKVVLQTIDKATAVLRKISGGSSEAAKALKDTRDRLKDLNAQQRAVGEFRELRVGLKDTTARLEASQAKVGELARQIAAAGAPTKAMARDFKNAKAQAAALGQEQAQMAAKVQALRDKLSAAGINTKRLAEHQATLKEATQNATASIARQTEALQAQAIKHRQLAQLKAEHAKEMMRVGMLAGGGIATAAAGNAMTRPLRTAVTAFMPNEDAAAQLKGALMRADGSVPAEFKKISDLATRLGDKLPGTTADFQEMMTMLIRQGMSAKAVLGGVGESAAYLGVQLKLPVAAAAEFAAKMQDATRTAEGDMMGLMDVIQRTFYLGVDSNNMLQGFTKLSPVLGILRKQGLGAAKDLAPLLVMMDQTGMAGESAGNALRKVFQAGLDAKKVSKANAASGLDLKFTDANGNFAGLDKLFDQLQKIKAINSDEKRTSLIKTIFGDDAETLQVLNTLMDKGKGGYTEIVNKMQAQADLRQRVNQQLSTVKAALDTAEGNFTNMAAEIGATVAPELKSVLDWLGQAASKIGQWARENPAIVSAMFKFVAALAAIAIVAGVVATGIAAILGPIYLLKFGLGLIGLKGLAVTGIIKGIGTAIGLVGRALMLTPIGRVLAGAAILGTAVYKLFQSDSKAPIPASRGFVSPMRFDARPPLMAAGAAGGAASTNNVTINAQGNSNPEDIAKAVQRALDDLDRKKRAGARSSLTDH